MECVCLTKVLSQYKYKQITVQFTGQLKCDGTRAETQISSFGETDESI